MMTDYPRGFYVNDALQLLLVMDEAGDTPALLGDWSRALEFSERRMPDSLEAQLNRIADNNNPTLADIALYRLAQLSLEQLDSTEAVAYIDTLTARFPESYYMPFGLKLKGDMYLTDPARLEEGREIYRRLLEEYDSYPFASEVRQKLRELEDRKVG
jgi:predicted negative regulator of RcsB-dependent stress response